MPPASAARRAQGATRRARPVWDGAESVRGPDVGARPLRPCTAAYASQASRMLP